jgi:hypothetical protein
MTGADQSGREGARWLARSLLDTVPIAPAIPVPRQKTSRGDSAASIRALLFQISAKEQRRFVHFVAQAVYSIEHNLRAEPPQTRKHLTAS